MNNIYKYLGLVVCMLGEVVMASQSHVHVVWNNNKDVYSSSKLTDDGMKTYNHVKDFWNKNITLYVYNDLFSPSGLKFSLQEDKNRSIARKYEFGSEEEASAFINRIRKRLKKN